MTECMKKLKAESMKKIRLTVLSKNTAALDLHQKLGFKTYTYEMQMLSDKNARISVSLAHMAFPRFVCSSGLVLLVIAASAYLDHIWVIRLTEGVGCATQTA